MADNHAAGWKKTSRRGRTAGAALAAAGLIALGAGTHAAAAGTETGQRSAGRAATAAAGTAAEPGLGSGNLIQSGDFFQQGLAPVGASVDLTGKQALSACSGEETMRELTKGTAAAYAEVTWTFDTSGTLLTESAAEGATDAAAAAYAKQLNAVVRDCQDEPAGHWYYGAGHAFTAAAGQGTWYPAFGGDGRVAGGVAVVRAGRRAAVVEISGQPTDDPAYVRGLASAALTRLAG
jgi:hypothetical protein